MAEETIIKATDQFFGKQECEKCIRHPSECFVKDVCKGFVDRSESKPTDKFEQYDQIKGLTKKTNEGFLGKA